MNKAAQRCIAGAAFSLSVSVGVLGNILMKVQGTHINFMYVYIE